MHSNQIKNDEFSQRLTEFLRENCSEKCGQISENELFTICQRGTKHAQLHHVDTEQNIALLVLYMMEIGVDYKKSIPPAWVDARLDDESLPIQQRLNRVYAGVIRANRENT